MYICLSWMTVHTELRLRGMIIQEQYYWGENVARNINSWCKNARWGKNVCLTLRLLNVNCCENSPRRQPKERAFEQCTYSNIGVTCRETVALTFM